MSPARTQEERRKSTRAALVAAGRKLFARDGFEAVSSEALVAEAGVTRGALYHHFEGKRGLFAEVFEQIEEELGGRLDLRGLESAGALGVLSAAIEQFLEISLESDVQRIALIDGPSVLGWDAWREVEERHGLGLIKAGLNAAMDAGEMKRLPVDALALMVLGALTGAALELARAEDQKEAKQRSAEALRALLEGLRA